VANVNGMQDDWKQLYLLQHPWDHLWVEAKEFRISRIHNINKPMNVWINACGMDEIPPSSDKGNFIYVRMAFVQMAFVIPLLRVHDATTSIINIAIEQSILSNF